MTRHGREEPTPCQTPGTLRRNSSGPISISKNGRDRRRSRARTGPSMLVRRLRSVIEWASWASGKHPIPMQLKNWLYEQKSSLPTVASQRWTPHSRPTACTLAYSATRCVPQPTESFDASGCFLVPSTPVAHPMLSKRPVFLPVFAVRHCTWVQQRVKNPRPSHPPPLPPHPISSSAQEWSENERSRISGILAQRLDKDSLAQRAGPGGAKLVYVESWKQVELANAAFG